MKSRLQGNISISVSPKNSQDILKTKLAICFPVGIIDQSEATYLSFLYFFLNTVKIMAFCRQQEESGKSTFMTQLYPR